MARGKTVIIAAMSLMCILAFTACNSGKSQWEVVSALKTAPSAQGGYTGLQVLFNDDTWGAALNGGNYFFTTADGGATWKETKIITNPCLHGPEVLDRNSVFVGCECDPVKYTSDGGATWNATAIQSYPMISMIDGTTGCMAKARSILSLSGDLSAPAEVPMPAEFREILSIAAISAGRFLFLDKGGAVRITTAGGKTWTLSATLDPKEYALEKTMTGARFARENEGLIVAFSLKKGEWRGLRTTDGGKTWKSEAIFNRGVGSPSISKDLRYVTIVPVAGADRIIVLRRKA